MVFTLTSYPNFRGISLVGFATVWNSELRGREDSLERDENWKHGQYKDQIRLLEGALNAMHGPAE